MEGDGGEMADSNPFFILHFFSLTMSHLIIVLLGEFHAPIDHNTQYPSLTQPFTSLFWFISLVLEWYGWAINFSWKIFQMQPWWEIPCYSQFYILANLIYRWREGPQNFGKPSGWEASKNRWTERKDKLLHNSTANTGKEWTLAMSSAYIDDSHLVYASFFCSVFLLAWVRNRNVS